MDWERCGSEYGIDTCWFNPQGRPRGAEIAIRYEIRSLHGLAVIAREG